MNIVNILYKQFLATAAKSLEWRIMGSPPDSAGASNDNNTGGAREKEEAKANEKDFEDAKDNVKSNSDRAAGPPGIGAPPSTPETDDEQQRAAGPPGIGAPPSTPENDDEQQRAAGPPGIGAPPSTPETDDTQQRAAGPPGIGAPPSTPETEDEQQRAAGPPGIGAPPSTPETDDEQQRAAGPPGIGAPPSQDELANIAMEEAIAGRYGPVPPEAEALRNPQQASVAPGGAGAAAAAVAATSFLDDAAKIGLKTAARAFAPLGVAMEVFSISPLADGTLGPNNPLHSESTKESPEDTESSKGNAAEERQKNIDKGIPESMLGPSGKPKQHSVDHSTKKGAKEAAAAEGKSEPMSHGSPNNGNPHYHSTDSDGNKQLPNVHHNFPKGR